MKSIKLNMMREDGMVGPSLHDDGVAVLLQVPGPLLRVQAGEEEAGSPVTGLDQQEADTDRQLGER